MTESERSLNHLDGSPLSYSFKDDSFKDDSFNRSSDFLSVEGRSRANLQAILNVASGHAQRLSNEDTKSTALAGKTVASLFFEDSTRTRLSFENAARKLSSDVMTFTAGTSSVKKGESIKDTVQTIDAMGVDAFVVRHSSPGMPHTISHWTDASVINAGDGAHEHPTQALIDSFALLERLGRNDLVGQNIAIVGDVLHSRVARSNVWAFTALGASVTLVGPKTLLPSNIDDWPVTVSNDFDTVLKKSGVVYMLRIQKERAATGLMSSVGEYVSRFGLTDARYRSLEPNTLIMHPGPMNRGIEISPLAADSDQSLVTRQVAAGIPVRMAVLEMCINRTINNSTINGNQT